MTEQLLEREQLDQQLASLVEREAHTRTLLLNARYPVAETHSDPEGGATHRQRYRRLVSRVQEIVQNVVPPGAVVVVVSKGDDDLLDHDGREAWHFPQNDRGVYAGYYPAEPSEAIQHLENLRAKGARYFLLPSTAYWWLDHYASLREYLDQSHRCVWTDRHCIVYELAPSQPLQTREPRPASIPTVRRAVSKWLTGALADKSRRGRISTPTG